jgi:hypothetical protein
MYLSKNCILKALSVLFNANPNVNNNNFSAIQYFLATDVYYKKHNNPCDSRNAKDRNEFCDYVAKIVSLDDNNYFSSFKQIYNKGNKKLRETVVSNFFTGTSVKESKNTSGKKFDYPASSPLLYALDGSVHKEESYYPNIYSYLKLDEERVALVIWLLRKSGNFNDLTIDEFKDSLAESYSKKMIDTLIPTSISNWEEILEKMNADCNKEEAIINIEDVNGKIQSQQIFYGTPGSGKSYKVKEYVVLAYPDEKERDEYVFRTTFHPDSDYASFVGCYKPRMVGKDIEYQFVPQAFTLAYEKAWQNPEKRVYLIIEEINRGNCAQIFGDLFQLLDRKDGVSEYPINADADLRQYLEKKLSKGKDGIKNGKLKLPANLYILATMNTSDQSLFPMDSAFKRRWSWECVPIDYDHKDSSKFIINIGGKSYKWNEFLRKVNEKIFAVTKSEDKQMGNFFINGNVDERQFIDKVMFYLWNDICKEEYTTDNNFFRNFTDDKKTETKGKEFTFNQLFGTERTKLLEGFFAYLGVNGK